MNFDTLQGHEVILFVIAIFFVGLSIMADENKNNWAQFFIGIALGIAIMLFSTVSTFADEWTTTDKAMESAYIALDVIDWRQTQDIARHIDRYETNPALGMHPNNARINTWFAAGLIVQPLIADALPDTWRKVWIGAGIALEGAMVGSNKHLGLSFKF